MLLVLVLFVGLFEIVGLVGAVWGWLDSQGGRGGLAGLHGKAGEAC